MGINLYAQSGQPSGDTNGGSIILMPGAANGAGTAGRVGIGTASPAHTLDVAGDGNFSGALSANGAQVYPGVFAGDSGSGGAAGAVPPPAAGDAAAGKFLKADGTWEIPTTQPVNYPSGVISPTWITGQGGVPALTGMTYCHRVIYAYGFFWAFGLCAVYRIDPSTGASTACTGTPNPTTGYHIYDAVAVNGKIYYTYSSTSFTAACALQVDEIDPNTLVAVNRINDSTHITVAGQNSICTDGTYLYVTT